jgi:hypothetical protein
LNKLFLHLALANGITSNPAKLRHDPFKQWNYWTRTVQNNKSNLLYKFAHTNLRYILWYAHMYIVPLMHAPCW